MKNLIILALATVLTVPALATDKKTIRKRVDLLCPTIDLAQQAREAIRVADEQVIRYMIQRCTLVGNGERVQVLRTNIGGYDHVRVYHADGNATEGFIHHTNLIAAR